MEQTVIQIGNSAGIIIPKTYRDEINIKVGDQLLVKRQNGSLFITPQKTKKNLLGGVDAKFMEMVDGFATEHQDVLEELAKR